MLIYEDLKKKSTSDAVIVETTFEAGKSIIVAKWVCFQGSFFRVMLF